MALVLPATLSPSKVSTFSDCALAFRYSAVDQLPEPPNLAASRGTLVHLALEHLFELDAPDRTPEAGHDALSRAIAELADHPDITDLNLSAEDTANALVCFEKSLALNPDYGLPKAWLARIVAEQHRHSEHR